MLEGLFLAQALFKLCGPSHDSRKDSKHQLPLIDQNRRPHYGTGELSTFGSVGCRPPK